MMVDVLAADLLLQGETPSGVHTLQLIGQNDVTAPGAMTGWWWLGKEQGTLRGRAAR